MLNNSGEIKALIELIDDPDENVFKSITERFISLGKEIVPIVKEQLDFTVEEDTIFKINQIIHKVNFKLLEDELLKWNASTQKSLWDATLIISTFIDTEADKNEIQFEIEKVKRSIWLEMNDYLTSLEEINIINKVIFSYYKFSATEDQYATEIDFGLNKLLTSKCSSAFSISIFYLLLGEMLKLPLKALQIPNQHLLAYCNVDENDFNGQKEDILFFIEPSTGQIYTHIDIENYLKKINHHIGVSSIKPQSTKDFVISWLMELASFYKKNNQVDKALDFTELTLKLG
jgi:regulator of sirC expression with transglutaminase-like and TPR domain